MTQQNTLVFWGNNQHSLLAPQSTKTFPHPQRTTLPHALSDLSASEKHIAFITPDGTLYTYGLNLDGRLGVGAKPDVQCSLSNPYKVRLPAPAVKVKCGFSHSCVQLSNGELWAWGLGDYGALGTGQFKSRGTPGRVILQGRVSNFSCGAMHSGFVDTLGSIYTCGSNEYGELGVNRPQKIATPVLINFSQKASQIECGVFYTLLLTTKGQVYGMGNNKYGQLGIGHKVNECHPTLIRQLSNITTIAAGYHSGALDAQGALYIWGSGSFGELLKPKKIVLSTPLDKLFIRGFFGVGISSHQQKVYAWGNNTYGQLGRGNFESAKEPVPLPGLANINFQSFACGVNFFLATTRDSVLPQERTTGTNLEIPRYNYLSSEGRSPYRSTTPPPLNYETHTLHNSAQRRSAERQIVLTPSRLNREIEEAQMRSRSRSRGEEHQIRDLITQQIRRSRSRRSNNYEELFISLSADYETLLARFKAMEDHLQLKNRSLLVQKEELGQIFREEIALLRKQNDSLLRDLSLSRQELRLAQNQHGDLITGLQGTFAGSQLNGQLTDEIHTLKEEFRVTIKQLQNLQEELASKQIQNRSLRSQLLDKTPFPFGELETLSKELKMVKDELKTKTRKLQDAEEELENRDDQLKNLKSKKGGNQMINLVQDARQELNEVNKANKALKDELRVVNRKYQELEEETAIARLDLKQVKQKKQVFQGSLKQETNILNEEMSYMGKELKVTKDELRITLRKLDQLEQELAVANIAGKEAKQKLNLKGSEIEQVKQENNSLLRELNGLKQELKKSLRALDKNEEEIATQAVQIRQLKDSKSGRVKLLENRLEDTEAQLNTARAQLKNNRQEVRHHRRNNEELTLDMESMKNSEKRLNDTLSETTRLLHEKEKTLAEIDSSHKKIQKHFLQEISVLEEDKSALVSQCQQAQVQKKHFEQELRASEATVSAIQKHYQFELNDAMSSLVKLKQVQQLNQIRVGQLKQIIEEGQKKYQSTFGQIDIIRKKFQEITEEKKQLLSMLEETREKHGEDLNIYKDKVIEVEQLMGSQHQKNNQLEVQIAYERQYLSKCQDSIKEVTEHRDRVCRQLQLLKENCEQQKQKIKELNFEVEKAKTLKKQVEVLTVQLERVENSTQQYRKEIEEILIQKEEILKELRTDLEKKQNQLERLQEKYEKETGSLNREVKDFQKKLSIKTKECNDSKRQCERRVAQVESLKESIQKLNRKLTFKNDEFDKEAREHQKTTEELNHLRRQYNKLKAEMQEVNNNNDQLVHEKQGLEKKVLDRKREIELMQGEKRQLEGIIQNLRKETEMAKKDLEESNWALEDSKRVNDQLSKANREFAQNEEEFTSKISELEGRVFELQDQNRSYAPRYEVLLQRNQQLDERNRQLSEMINKAIEIQAEAYKSNILKEVEINTGQIIQQMKDEQQFKPKRRREPLLPSQSIDPSQTENMRDEPKSPGLISKIKDEPYNRLMQDKISFHKKRVSDSAQKLAGILQLGQGDGQGEAKSFERSVGLRRQEDYQRINSHMQSLNNQKQEFMQKINNFAEKLKIL